VIEIKRFTSIKQWFYVYIKDMAADIGTRQGANLDDIGQDSTWRNGYPWMKLDLSKFPISTPGAIKLKVKSLK
jgi:hypothetical protein